MKLLGIGSRIQHPEFEKGVVTILTSKQYWVTFIDSGLETIAVDTDFEVIEAVTDGFATVYCPFYSSLTTFNVLFQNKSDHFIGDKTK